jgi:hypothetical protein
MADESHIPALGVQHYLLPLALPAHCEVVEQEDHADHGDQRHPPYGEDGIKRQ